MSRWTEINADLLENPRDWLVTGAAGFIGSHLVEELLRLGQRVLGLDDFSTGSRQNLEDVASRLGRDAFGAFQLVEGDIRDASTCSTVCAGGPLILHQAALGSVPRSIAEPRISFAANVEGFVNMLEAARQAGSPRFVYASSSSVYGDHPGLPKVESEIGSPLSPYAATKRIDEIWAETCFRTYTLPIVGLRYFNVFGPRQDPNGPYAAVIPRWIGALCANDRPRIFGDGETSRDFCPVANAVRANLLAALSPNHALGKSFNVALGKRTTLNELFAKIRDVLAGLGIDCAASEPIYEDFRGGDVRHSLADLSETRSLLGYEPPVDLDAGLRDTLEWSADHVRLSD